MSKEVWEKSGGICYICGERMLQGSRCTLLNFSVDHWNPKSKAKGKGMGSENLNGAHNLCNNQKGNMRPEEITPEFIRSCQWQIRKLLKAWS